MAEGKCLVGVDVGSSSIKVCHLKESRRGLSLQHLGYAPLPPQTIVDGHVMNTGIVVESLQRIFHDAKIKERDVAMSVYGQSVIIRKITVPMMTLAELDEQIQWEAEQHIPFDIKEMQIDYQVLRRRADSGQMDLLLVAAKRDEINDYAQIAREAKLRVVTVDVDAFTIQNVFEHTRGLPEDQTLALINVGATLSTVNIIAQGISAFTRDIANGGNYVTEQIQRQLNVPFEQAEMLKCGGDPSQGVPVPPQVYQVVETVTDSIAAEIQRSLDFFMATSGEAEVSRIFVTGGSANLPHLVRAIERRARVPVELFLPTEKILVESADVNPQLLQATAAQLSVALGLAMRKDREKRS